MTIRNSILLLAAVVAGDAQAVVAAPPALAFDPRDVTPVQAPPNVVEPHAVATAQPPAATTEPEQGGNPLWVVPLRQLSATRERPLFAPSRRPPPVPVATQPTFQLASAPPPPPKAVELETPQLSLVGTVAGEAGGIGVFLNQADKTVLRLKTGEGHKGWFLREVRGRAVVLQKGYQTTVLTLPIPDMSKADAPPTTPPSPAGAGQGFGPAVPAVPVAAKAPAGSPAAGVPVTFSPFTLPARVRR
jgi:hypothetical protein